MLSMASQATPQGPRGFSLALMITAPLGKGRESARASMGSVTIGNPTVAAAAAAAESCRKERRERQAGFSSTGMDSPPQWCSHSAARHTQIITFLESRASYLHAFFG